VLGGGALLNVVLNAVLIPPFGLLGAAVATAIATATWNLWMLVEVHRRHGLNPTVFMNWRGVFAGR
jgi:O-antigen/teichoic acid export membrane protein